MGKSWLMNQSSIGTIVDASQIAMLLSPPLIFLDQTVGS